MFLLSGNASGSGEPSFVDESGDTIFSPTYQINNSLRFRSGSSAYMSRTVATTTSRTKWTFGCWIKRGLIPTAITPYVLFSSYFDANNVTNFYISGSYENCLDLNVVTGGATAARVVCYPRMRDPTAWYHVMCVYDSDNVDAGARVRFYMNGERVSDMQFETQPTLGALSSVNLSGASHQVGASNGATFFDGAMAGVHFIDGQALDPRAFSKFHKGWGSWVATAYTGPAIGTNGFALFFDNTTSTTTLGYDTGGNGLNFTTSGFSLTAGRTYDALWDVPFGAGGSTGNGLGNYCVLNPVDSVTIAPTEGNLTYVTTGTGQIVCGTLKFPPTGQWYAEVEIGSMGGTGVTAVGVNRSRVNDDYYYYHSDGQKNSVSGGAVSYGATYTTGDFIGILFNSNTGAIEFYKNNASQGTAFTGISTDDLVKLSFGQNIVSTTGRTNYWNFGQRPFNYTKPSGFTALNTNNFPNPAIGRPPRHITVAYFTGNGAGMLIGNGSHQDGAVRQAALVPNQVVTKSLRLRADNTAYLVRTQTAGTGRRNASFSIWFRRTKIGVYHSLFSNDGDAAGTYEQIRVSNTDKIDWVFGGGAVGCSTTRVFRDPTKWYHLCCIMDTTQATGTDRVKIYVDGELCATTGSYPALNFDTFWGVNATKYSIGARLTRPSTIDLHFDGLVAEAYYVDGTTLTPASFGELNATSNYWVPKAYSGSVGSQGTYLKFADASSTANLGTATSGNTMTTNGLSITTGITYDSFNDTPTDVYNTLSSNKYLVAIPTEGGIKQTAPGGATVGNTVSTIYLDPRNGGKWYFETTIGATYNDGSNTYPSIGISNDSTINSGPGFISSDYGVGYAADGKKWLRAIQSAFAATWAANDVIGVAFNMDANPVTVTFYKNNVSQGVIDIHHHGISTLAGRWGWVAKAGTKGTAYQYVNFGQQPFVYTPPADHVAIRENAIDMEILGILKKPDFQWHKGRSVTQSSAIIDSYDPSKYVASDSTSGEATSADLSLKRHNSGLDLEATTINNTVSQSQVAILMKLGDGFSANTVGVLSSDVSVNPTARLSIARYTGTGSPTTVGHGLTVAPKTMTVKDRTSAVMHWAVQHRSMVAANVLGLAQSVVEGPAPYFSSTYVGATTANINIDNANISGKLHNLWLWGEKHGFSRMFKYVGNGNADGVYFDCGFRPLLVIHKNLTGVANWSWLDSKRDPYNNGSSSIKPNLSTQEATLGVVDFLATGFKLRTTAIEVNTVSQTYIVMAFADVPLKFSLAR